MVEISFVTAAMFIGAGAVIGGAMGMANAVDQFRADDCNVTLLRLLRLAERALPDVLIFLAGWVAIALAVFVWMS